MHSQSTKHDRASEEDEQQYSRLNPKPEASARKTHDSEGCMGYSHPVGDIVTGKDRAKVDVKVSRVDFLTSHVAELTEHSKTKSDPDDTDTAVLRFVGTVHALGSIFKLLVCSFRQRYIMIADSEQDCSQRDAQVGPLSLH